MAPASWQCLPPHLSFNFGIDWKQWDWDGATPTVLPRLGSVRLLFISTFKSRAPGPQAPKLARSQNCNLQNFGTHPSQTLLSCLGHSSCEMDEMLESKWWLLWGEAPAHRSAGRPWTWVQFLSQWGGFRFRVTSMPFRMTIYSSPLLGHCFLCWPVGIWVAWLLACFLLTIKAFLQTAKFIPYLLNDEPDLEKLPRMRAFGRRSVEIFMTKRVERNLSCWTLCSSCKAWAGLLFCLHIHLFFQPLQNTMKFERNTAYCQEAFQSSLFRDAIIAWQDNSFWHNSLLESQEATNPRHPPSSTNTSGGGPAPERRDVTAECKKKTKLTPRACSDHKVIIWSTSTRDRLRWRNSFLPRNGIPVGVEAVASQIKFSFRRDLLAISRESARSKKKERKGSSSSSPAKERTCLNSQAAQHSAQRQPRRNRPLQTNFQSNSDRFKIQPKSIFVGSCHRSRSFQSELSCKWKTLLIHEVNRGVFVQFPLLLRISIRLSCPLSVQWTNYALLRVMICLQSILLHSGHTLVLTAVKGGPAKEPPDGLNGGSFVGRSSLWRSAAHWPGRTRGCAARSRCFPAAWQRTVE